MLLKRGYRASETRDEQTETPTPKNLPQYVPSQVEDDIVYCNRCCATPTLPRRLRRLAARAIRNRKILSFQMYVCDAGDSLYKANYYKE